MLQLVCELEAILIYFYTMRAVHMVCPQSWGFGVARLLSFRLLGLWGLGLKALGLHFFKSYSTPLKIKMSPKKGPSPKKENLSSNHSFGE